MENHGFIIGKNPELSMSLNQHLGLGNGHNLFLGHSHKVGLGCFDSHDLELGLNHENGLALGHTYNAELIQEQKVAPQHSHMQNLDEISLELDRDSEPETNQDHSEVDELVRNAENHDIALTSNLEMAIVENHESNEKLNSTMDRSKESSIVLPLDMVITSAQLVVDPLLLKSEPLALAPNCQLTVNQEFPDVHSCRRALRDAAIALRFEMQTVKSDKNRFTAKCASEGCPWRIHAAKLPGVPTFTIRTIHDSHTCGGITHLGHQQASVQWVADSVEQCVRENPDYKPKEILEEIHRVHGITLSYKQAWRGKERIMAAVRGSFEEDYHLLPEYCDQIKRTNPGSIALVYGNTSDKCFQRLFVSFQASIYGFFNACRPLIGLDRTPLKSKYLGTLLFATGFDGEGALFPLAFAVVDEENNDNWMWFLSELHGLLEINAENMPRLTILSDRKKGIVDGIEENFPTAFHGFCMRHLSDGFQKEFNNSVLTNLLWEAAYALTALDFEAKVLEIEEISQEAAYWIRQIPPHWWAQAYFEGTRFGHLTVSVAESFNNWIVEASGLPIIQMMECLRRQLMTWFNERREVSMQWTSILVPSAERHVTDALEYAHTYQVIRANEAEYEIVSHEGSCVVDIRARNCSCRGWQLFGLPCAHAVAALLSCGQNVYRFTESCFTVANYRKAYSQTIHPIPDKTLWKESQNEVSKDIEVKINPPKLLRPPGRPRKRRSRAEDIVRGKRVVHCSRCNQTGHFRSTCVAPT